MSLYLAPRLMTIMVFYAFGLFFGIILTSIFMRQSTLSLGYPVRIHYAYTFIQNGVHIFRYDNAPHHRNILTFPHHKHVDSDERPIPSDQPTLNQVIIEIDALLEK